MTDARNRWESPAAEQARSEEVQEVEPAVDQQAETVETADAVPSVQPTEYDAPETVVVREEELPELKEGQVRAAYLGPRQSIETVHGFFNKDQAVVVSEDMFNQLAELTNPDGSKLFGKV